MPTLRGRGREPQLALRRGCVWRLLLLLLEVPVTRSKGRGLVGGDWWAWLIELMERSRPSGLAGWWWAWPLLGFTGWWNTLIEPLTLSFASRWVWLIEHPVRRCGLGDTRLVTSEMKYMYEQNIRLFCSLDIYKVPGHACNLRWLVWWRMGEIPSLSINGRGR